MSVNFDIETARLTEVLQQSARALLQHIQANTVIVSLDEHSPAYIVVGDNGALSRLCHTITGMQPLTKVH